jgi:hypothetical protein
MVVGYGNPTYGNGKFLGGGAMFIGYGNPAYGNGKSSENSKIS